MVVFENEEVCIVHKPAGLSAQDDLTGEASVLTHFAGMHCITRLDKRVSGLMLLAKNAKAAALWSNYLIHGSVEKKYHCVVAQRPEMDHGECINWIKKGRKAQVFSEAVSGAQRAELRYRVVQSSVRYHLLTVEIFTGRFHQIRAQLAAMGCPIVGDLKYGAKRNSPDGSIWLCCTSIKVGDLTAEIPIPQAWARYGFEKMTLEGVG